MKANQTIAIQPPIAIARVFRGIEGKGVSMPTLQPAYNNVKGV